ncbi:arginase [Nocardiopsis mwathae]|uniref:Arginase n=1 Tax=Nocardiopsis mwathae TaxID=1472723 RepID=A0A7X0D673_9ACTN|nr:arginase family protein [Nocardiopsis mwathae]MBB6171814.1 arginase [Nocardiopsis mwathae]
MTWQRDVDLVVPLWQGGDDVRTAAGASALARLIPPNGNRLHVAVTDGPRTTIDGIRSLDAIHGTLTRLRDRLTRRDPQRTLTLGGDCLSDLVAIQHLATRHPDMTLYWVDAHPDLNTPATSPSQRAHGMVLRTLLGDGHPRLTGANGAALPTPAVTLVGARDLDPPETRYIRHHGIAWVDTVELLADPTRVTAPRPAGTPAYIHLDIDVCDPFDLPAVAVPTPDGPRAGTVAEALAAITAHHDVVGIGICEYAPVIEHDEARLATLLAALDLTG